jgi:hypothetical protein
MSNEVIERIEAKADQCLRRSTALMEQAERQGIGTYKSGLELYEATVSIGRSEAYHEVAAYLRSEFGVA